MARPEQKLQPTKERQDRYLAARGRMGTLSGACKLARVSPHTVYAWREQDQADGYPAEEFTALEKAAHAVFCEVLENEAYRRAVMGTRKPVYYQGKRVGHIREYSDTLLLAMMNAHMPEKYGRYRHEHTGAGGAPIEVTFVKPPGGG